MHLGRGMGGLGAEELCETAGGARFLPSYGKNIHPASVRRLKGLGVRYLQLDWIDNHQPFIFGSLTKSGVRTDKVLCHATARQI
jgi:hypothetical protein